MIYIGLAALPKRVTSDTTGTRWGDGGPLCGIHAATKLEGDHGALARNRSEVELVALDIDELFNSLGGLIGRSGQCCNWNHDSEGPQGASNGEQKTHGAKRDL